jgi:hypothetical protein
VLRTLVNEGKLGLEPSLGELYRSMRFLGLGPLPSALLVAAGRLTGGRKLKDLYRCPIDHNADSRVLRDCFRPEYLQRLLSFSSDGLNVTAADLAAAQAEQLAAEPGLLGHSAGSAEYVPMIYVFGESPGSISKAALTSLYRDNRFPAGWYPRRVPTWPILLRIARFFFTRPRRCVSL